jgi:hypothetical protein
MVMALFNSSFREHPCILFASQSADSVEADLEKTAVCVNLSWVIRHKNCNLCIVYGTPKMNINA